MSGANSYHGFASESDYHEHYTLLALVEAGSSQAEKVRMGKRIREIDDCRVFVETRIYSATRLTPHSTTENEDG